MRALIIEDHERLAGFIASGLSRIGFAVDQTAKLTDADDAIAAARFDLVLLDLGLPDGDGIEWLKKARSNGMATPVLIITARGELGDRVRGLDTGADDYLTKPFDVDELLARCRALMRRPASTLGAVLDAGDLVLDTVSREVRVKDKTIELGRREAGLLETLLRRCGRVVTRASLEENAYSFDDEVTPNALEANISRLRRKLADAGSAVTIHTIRGVGYLLKSE